MMESTWPPALLVHCPLATCVLCVCVCVPLNRLDKGWVQCCETPAKFAVQARFEPVRGTLHVCRDQPKLSSSVGTRSSGLITRWMVTTDTSMASKQMPLTPTVAVVPSCIFTKSTHAPPTNTRALNTTHGSEHPQHLRAPPLLL